MTKSATRDAQLKSRIERNQAKLDKYKKVRSAISNNQLDYKRSLEGVNDMIDKVKSAIEKVSGNVGYAYLSTFQTKLSDDLKVLKEYRDFVKDSNTSFVNLASDLDTKTSNLKASINKDQAEFNEGHIPFVDEFYYFWE